GRLIEVPVSPRALLAPLISPAGKLRALAEPLVHPREADGDESLAQLMRRRLGREAGSLAATVMAAGVYAGDPERLSARGAFPRLVALEESAGSLVRGGLRRARAGSAGRGTTHLPVEGMAGLAEGLARWLGDGWRPGFPVTGLGRREGGWLVTGTEELAAEHVVLALAPLDAARLVPEEVAAVLARAVAAPVAVVGLGGRTADLPVPLGIGVLPGPGSGLRVRGFLFESRYAPGRAPDRHTLVKAVYGGGPEPEAVDQDDESLIGLAGEELGRVIGIPVYPSWARVIRHRPGIPQYQVGHPAWLAELDRARAAHPGLHLAGWGYRGVGLTALAEEAVRLGALIGGA
ncbi:MAG: protoporphyrinogen/coproporphyrinogen oxidase, partial [Acidimicrobiia bacterium]